MAGESRTGRLLGRCIMNYFPLRLYKILLGAWRRRYIIVMPIFILPIFGVFIAITNTKQYASHTSMLIQETAKMNPFLEDLAVSAMLKERIDALKTLLHSRHILTQVALDLNLVSDTSNDRDKDLVISQLANNLSMSVVGKDLIRIDLKASNPNRMKQTLEIVSARFVEQLLAPERSSIEDSARFLEEHLLKRQDELTDSEKSLAEFRVKHQNALPEMHTSNMARLASLRQDLAERQALLAGAERNVGGISQRLSSTNPVVGKIEEKLIETQGELAMLRSRYTDKHSKVQGLQRRLTRLEAERQTLLNTDQRIVTEEQLWDRASSHNNSNAKGEPAILISQLNDLQSAKNKADRLHEEVDLITIMIKEIEAGQTKFRKHEAELFGLQRNLRVKRDLYENLLERREMAEVMGSLGQFEQSKRIKIIDRPFTPSRPINLPILLHAILGLIAGSLLGTGLAVVLELTNSTIRYREQVEALTSLKVISRIPSQQDFPVLQH